MKHCSRRLISWGMTLLIVAQAAPALETEERDTVATRSRPEVDAQGLALGAFDVDASVSLGYMQDDNIFATDTAEVDDEILLIAPELRIASGWSRHALAAGVEAQIARYSDFSDEDYEDVRLFADGRLDLARNTLSAALSQSELHEPRSSPDDIGGIEPTTFDVTAARVDWLFQPGAFFLRPDLRFETFRFDDTQIRDPAETIVDAACGPATLGVRNCDNSDRDRDDLSGGLRIGKDIAEHTAVFLEGRMSRVDYDRNTDFEGFERSSDGYEALAGTTVDFGTVFGEVYGGYRHWRYDDDRFETVDGLAFGLDLTWNITGLTTLTSAASRTIESTTIVNASGVERTGFRVAVDHELLRNLIIYASMDLAQEKFEGIDRDDDLFDAQFGARYLMNRRLHLFLGCQNEERDSSGSSADGQEYDINRILVRIQGNL